MPFRRAVVSLPFRGLTTDLRTGKRQAPNLTYRPQSTSGIPLNR